MRYTPWSARESSEEAKRERALANGGHGGFDPYRAWLNVREVHRPLNAYQLLNLPELEDDADKIRAAAKLQRVAIQAHRFEAPTEIWEQVNSELEEAINILLDPDKKTAYDVSLRLQEEVDRGPQVPLGARAERGGAGGLVVCSECRTPAPATRRFCSNCGSNLWDSCFRCGTLVMAGEKFCGACGANLAAVLQEQLQLCEEQLHEAEQLRAECRYNEALARLNPISKLEHSRLREHARRAGEMIRAITLERDRAQEEVQRIYQEAQQQASEGQYEAVVALLEGAPPPLRTAAVEHLLEEARFRLGEVAQLEEEIRQAVRENRPSDLLSLVDRMLTLKPDHPHAYKLACKFCDHLIERSEAKLIRHQFEAAVQVLEQIPKAVRNGAWERAYRRAAELLWLSWDLRHAPVVDGPLIALAQRLLTHLPGDPKGQAALEELKRRWNAGVHDVRRPTIPWAAAPRETYLGYPVEWLTGFQRFDVKEGLDRRPLVEHPGCFHVAAGLALQGLGKAAMKSNLLPGEHGVMGTVNQLLRMRPTRAAWGLDLSSSGLKAIKLSLGAHRPDQVILEACDFIEHKKLLSQAVNEDEEKTLIEETIRMFLARNEVKSARVVLGLPSRMVLIRPLTLPPFEESKLAGVLQYEARRHVPMPLEELVWGYEYLEPPDREAKEIGIALVAAKRLPLKDRLSRLKNLGLPVDIVQSDSLALRNFLAYEFLAEQRSEPAEHKDAGTVTAVVDVGSDATNIVFYSPRLTWFHTTGLGSHNLTKALVRELRLTSMEAEAVKRNPAKADALDQALAVMEPFFEDLARELQSSLALFQKTHPHQRIERILGLGGGFQTHGLLRYLWLGR